MVKERRKAKEAQAKMELHSEKAEHAGRRLNPNNHPHLHTHHHAAAAATGPTAPMYPPPHYPQPVVGATAAPAYPPSGAKYF